MVQRRETRIRLSSWTTRYVWTASTLSPIAGVLAFTAELLGEDGGLLS